MDKLLSCICWASLPRLSGSRPYSMTDQVIGGKGELHARPANSVPTSPPIACYTLYNRIIILLIYSDTLRNLFIGRLMLILNELHPEYEEVSSLSQGCDEMSPLVEEYTYPPSKTPSFTDVTSASIRQRLPGSSSTANPSISTANSCLVTQSR